MRLIGISYDYLLLTANNESAWIHFRILVIRKNSKSNTLGFKKFPLRIIWIQKANPKVRKLPFDAEKQYQPPKSQSKHKQAQCLFMFLIDIMIDHLANIEELNLFLLP